MEATAAEPVPFAHERIALLGTAIVVSVTHVTVPFWGTAIIIGAALLALVLSGDKKQRWAYVAIGSVLIFSIVSMYTLVANHLFLLAYLVWAVAIHADDDEGLVNTSRYILIAVMGIAALQKLINPYFISGDALAWYVASGESFGNLIAYANPGWAEQTAQVFADSQNAMAPVDSNTPTSTPPGAFLGAMIALSWFVFALELVVALSWIQLPGKLSTLRQYAPHITFAFVWGTYLMRNEAFFFALVALLGTLGVPREPDQQPSKLWWFGIGTVAFMLVVGFFGFRPPFLQ